MIPTPTLHRSVADHLRDGTRAEHRAIEQSLELKAAMTSLTTYRQLLERLWGLHYAWEHQALTQLDANLLHGRRKTPWLHADLCALGLSDEQIRALPVPTEENSRWPRAAALGALYVLEGASLGGEIIFRYGVQRLGISPDHRGRFFYGYGPATALMWQEFRELLQTEYEQDRLTPDDALAGAKAMFAHMESWLNRKPQ